jgi:hypothetical protein
MYAAVRRYEGVSDPREVVRIVNEGSLCPLSAKSQGLWITTW